jgi:uncharacterized membrane protein
MKVKKVKIPDSVLMGLMAGAVVGLLVGLLLIQPAMEARTYNKFTDGTKATLVDAIFGNLRITGK